jgi:hypothetical protein
MSAAKTPAATPAEPVMQRPCALEDEYGQFSASVMERNIASAPLMRDLNRVFQIVSGLGVVLRIVGGNDILKDGFEPGTDSEPPLSNTAIAMLESMAATVCEMIADDISATANGYRIRGGK